MSRTINELIRFSSNRRCRLNRIVNIMSRLEPVNVIILLELTKILTRKKQFYYYSKIFCVPSALRAEISKAGNAGLASGPGSVTH